MSWKLTILTGACLLMSSSLVFSQRVLYCEPYSDRFTLREELVAKVGDYYWVETTSRKRNIRHRSDPSQTEERTFDVYDSRMNLMNMIGEFTYPGNPLREYLVADEDHFDQVHLLAAGTKKVGVWLQRYGPEGRPLGAGRIVGGFPFYEPGNSFLLVRSEDRSRILLLGFESLSSSSPKLHALLFDADWELLSSRVYHHPFITQPTIQDDFTNYPLEDFNKGPLKLANNGEWLMTAPSRTNSNFLLFHFSGTDTAVACKEIPLPPFSAMEDVDLSINNDRGEAVAGVLSDFHYSTLKNVQVVHYSMGSKAFDFDSSYRLATVAGGRVKDGNLVKENFIAVPGKGFMLLKEYGRPFEDWYVEDEYDQGWDPALMYAMNAIPAPAGPAIAQRTAPVTREGYARYRSMNVPPDHERGDLSLYYFPAIRGDSSWSGVISKEQVTELNSPNLSYMVLPMNGHLFFLYNSFVHGESLYATTTVINPQGELVSDQGILFWHLKNTLSFQESRQIAPDEVVIPYDKLGRIGFALVLFR
ncbi:MAG TPA: hypothetical protein VGM30_07400 [Puia sp.]|jgi:hypothetical protein